MVVFFVRNSRNPDSKVVPITVALELSSFKPTLVSSGSGIPDLHDPEGGRLWNLLLETSERSIDGNFIAPEIILGINEVSVQREIETAIGRISKKIDWGVVIPDSKAPQLVEITPSLDQTENVSIYSNIIVRLKDPLPAAGIDLSTLKVKVNGIEIHNDSQRFKLFGNIFDLTFRYEPKRILS